MEYNKDTLDNGLRLIICPMCHAHSVSVLFYVGVGSCYENDAEAGISHFIEHMCFKGTTKRPSSIKISEAIEGVGGIFNGGTDRELTSYWCKLASQHLELAIDVIMDILHNPLFRAEDVEKERQVIIEEINMSLDSPSQRVAMLFDEIMWPGKPLGRDIAGTKKTVSAITRTQMLEYMANYYVPNNMLISIAGDIEPRRGVELVNAMLRDWKPGKKPVYIPSAVTQNAPQTRYEFREIEQVNISLGVEGLSLFHPDRFVVDIINMILGEGMSSRLFAELRERLGLAYDIHSYAEHFRDSGVFAIQAGIDPGKCDMALRAILKQLSAMRFDVAETELCKAKEMAKGRLLLSMEDSRNVASWYGGQEMLTENILTEDDLIRLIEGITLDDLKRVSQQIFVTEKLNLAMVGPIKEAETLKSLLEI